jgi:hypothetical protein
MHTDTAQYQGQITDQRMKCSILSMKRVRHKKIEHQCSKKASKCPPASSLYYAHSAKKASNMSSARARAIARVRMQDYGGACENSLMFVVQVGYG